MLEVKHTVEILGLDKLLEVLQGLRPSGAPACCESNHSAGVPAPEVAPTQQIPVYTMQDPAPVVTPAQQQQPAPVQPQPVTAPMQQQPAPVQQAPVQQAPAASVPTAAPSYDLNQISLAAMQLRDGGKLQELLALLSQFGVQMVTHLPPERYGEFATALRGLGAKI